jgi:serine protease Do
MNMRTFCLVLGLCAGPLLAEPVPEIGEPNLRMTPTVKVFRAVRDSVVNVNTTQTVRQRFGFFNDDPFFRRFFGGPGVERERTSLGSGFIIHADGYIVTNAHVVDGADSVEVRLGDKTQLPARVLASDADHDLAVLRIDVPEGRTLEPVALGTSQDLMPGEPVIAIGNPMGYEHSVTTGIISALNRPLPLRRDHELQHMIQTDTPINPGNSGGPLLNAYGQVIGINTAIRGDAQNIGFAIPVDDLRKLIFDLLSPLALNRVDLGGRVVEKASIAPPANVAVQLQWQPDGEDVEPRPFDRINGQPVANIFDACIRLLQIKPGQTATLTQGDASFTLTARAPKISDAQRLAQAMMGLTPRELTSADRARLRIDFAGGLLVDSVARGGPAARAGLQPGDMIVQLGRYRIADLQDLAVLLDNAKGGMQADVYVVRQGRLGRVRIRLASGGSKI